MLLCVVTVCICLSCAFLMFSSSPLLQVVAPNRIKSVVRSSPGDSFTSPRRQN